MMRVSIGSLLINLLTPAGFLYPLLGEVPSRLETLTSMASELALSAVHNGRFHHATASLALEEQLASRRRLTLIRPSSGKFAIAPFKSAARPVVRSASSSFFSSVGGESAFTDELSKVDSALSGELFDSQTSNNNSNSPGMVHSSQSDNSTNAEDDDFTESFTSETEDCAAGQWAAALVAVADQSLEKDKNSSSLSFGGRNRSISESSDISNGDISRSSSALSKSPVGFWYVRPGDGDTSEEDDEELICWTPSLQSSCHNGDSSLDDDKGIPPHVLSPSGFSASNLSRLLTESPSGFSSSNLGRLLSESSSGGVAATQSATTTAFDECSHPSSNADDELGPITPPTIGQPPAPSAAVLSAFKPTRKTFHRSISYSAFSTAPNTDTKNNLLQSTGRSSLTSVQENGLFRTYFVKFVDLLVVRETERLVHNSNEATPKKAVIRKT